LAIAKTSSSATPVRPRGGPIAWAKRNYTGVLFILPLLAFLFVYQAYPIVKVFQLSFTDYQYITDTGGWVGLTNYANALQDSDVWHGFRIALEFTLIFLPGAFIIPLGIALLLNKVRNQWVAGLYRVLLYVPALIPGPMIFIMWNWIYNPTLGLANYVAIDVLHVASRTNPPLWLGSDTWYVPCLAFMEWWWGIGYHTIFIMIGLAGISKEVYEAARLDGCSELSIAWRICVPLLKPMLLILLVLRTGSAFGLMVEYLVLKPGTDAGNSWTVLMYNNAFQGSWSWGYAAAIGWIGTVFMLLAVAVQYRVLRSDY
jgi:multiple sugar transport system permease protein